MTKVDSQKAQSHKDEVKTLTKREIRYARSVVRRMHPLRNLPVTLALPFLSYFYKEPQEEEKNLVKNDDLRNGVDQKIINMATQIATFGVIHDTDSE